MTTREACLPPPACTLPYDQHHGAGGRRRLEGLADTLRLEPGEAIGEQYEIVEHLASGGMGNVYRAYDHRLGRHVAIKLLRRAPSSDHSLMVCFRREVAAMSRVVHPNVVAIHDYGRHRSRWYIVMEHVPGESLAAILAKRRRLPMATSLGIVRQVASGLAEAHALGIVHRDIKPGNILIRRLASGASLAKVVDFGVAGWIRRPAGFDGRGARRLQGTPLYMSPEQASALPLDGRSDAYALATVCFEMLTGRRPHPCESRRTSQILEAIANRRPRMLSQAADDVQWPARLEREMARALSRDPSDRHDGVVALANALDAAAGLRAGSAGARQECRHCGHVSLGAGDYCSRCGKRLKEPRCPECGGEREPGTNRCGSCGAVLPRQARASWRTPTALKTRTGRLDATMPTAAVLVARIDAAPESGDGDEASAITRFTELVEELVEARDGQVLAVIGREAVATFGPGQLRGREVEGAIGVGEELLRRCATEGAIARVGVEVGGILSPSGNGDGGPRVGGSGLDDARRAVERAWPSSLCLGPTAQRLVSGGRATRPVDDGHAIVVGASPGYLPETRAASANERPMQSSMASPAK